MGSSVGGGRAAAVPVLLLGLLGSLGACADTPAEPEPPAPSLVAEIVQLRRDQVLERVEVALENVGDAEVVVTSLLVRVPGFRSGGPVAKDSQIPAQQVVNLPWTYGTVRCDDSSMPPTVGRAVVVLRVSTGAGQPARRVRLVAGDPSGLMQQIADRTCTVQRVRREVGLAFDDRWRAEDTPDGVVLHGILRARLLVDEPRTVSEVAGAIMYGLRPDASAGPVADPLADLTPGRREVAIPVETYAARCTPHTIGEIKKPYEFLVWVSAPEGEPVAVTPDVGRATKDALRQACAF
jgi:hypothetical protein